MKTIKYIKPANIQYLPKRDIDILTHLFIPNAAGQAYVYIACNQDNTLEYNLPSVKSIDYADIESQMIKIPIEVYADALFAFKNIESPSWHIEIKWETKPADITIKPKMYRRSVILVWLYLLDCCRKSNTRGILRDIDLDDVIANTGIESIDTIRDALKLLHDNHIIFQRINERDAKLIDVWCIGYSECTRQASGGYIQISGEEFSSLFSLNSGLKLVIGLYLILIDDVASSKKQKSSVMINTLMNNLPSYLRPYNVRGVLEEADMQEIFRFIFEKTDYKIKHRKTQTRYKILFGRLKSSVLEMEKRVKDYYYKQAIRKWNAPIPKAIENILKACVPLLDSYDPDSVISAVEYGYHVSAKYDIKVKKWHNYISEIIREGNFANA